MNKSLPGIAVMAVAVFASGAAVAEGRFRSDAYYGHARVVHVDPITEIVRVDDPREICWTESVTHRSPRRPASATPEIVGGIIGGVVGNQFGSGRGKGVATVAGALLGGSIAHDYKKRRAYGHDVYTEPVERCEIRHDYYEEERVVGYDVQYRYNGRIYHTRMDRDPGPRVRVRVNVAVVE
ncbi:MAG: glycine zipper 2TM domain-containing protein [Gammaproteobacteria bacterium]|nr:glycine zipper 2TM domain-containing protein [Gammaproteobacteria bacterium]